MVLPGPEEEASDGDGVEIFSEELGDGEEASETSAGDDIHRACWNDDDDDDEAEAAAGAVAAARATAHPRERPRAARSMASECPSGAEREQVLRQKESPSTKAEKRVQRPVGRSQTAPVRWRIPVHYEQPVRPYRWRIPVHYEQTVRLYRWRIPVHYEQ